MIWNFGRTSDLLPAPEAFELGADLEMFRDLSPLGQPCRQQPGPHWELGFGPIGGTRPIWGLYRFRGAERVASERQLLWRSCPTRDDLLRWCARTMDLELATHLVDVVGAIDAFYDRYFAARPDFAMPRDEVAAPLSRLVIHASTAMEEAEMQSSSVKVEARHDHEWLGLADSRVSV